MVASLGLVLLLAHEIRRGPSIGRALEAMFGVAEREGEIPRGEEVDTRVRPDDPEDAIPGTFFSPREVRPLPDRTDDYFPDVQPAYLEAVRDDTFHRGVEHDGWFHLLRILAEAAPEALEEASRGRVSFAQLFRQSADYRGHVVRLRGTVRGAFPMYAPKNDYGIERYHQLWLFPDDNPSSPIILFSLEVPEDFPAGMTLAERAEATGFFFKRMAYEATDTLRTAPCVLVRGIRWERPPPAPSMEPQEPGSPWTVFGAAMLFSAALAVYVYWRTRPGGNSSDGPAGNRGGRRRSGDGRVPRAAGDVPRRTQEEIGER